jgi:mRNA-degrading endonuclease YafQ of YafQ-DinJ toxin-antitoxin module
MAIILDPSILFISQQEWQDEEKRDNFLEHFLSHLEAIVNYNIAKIYWTDELEELLINHVTSPPWISDVNWGNKFLPILYRQFYSIKEFLYSEEKLNPCQSTPILKLLLNRPEILDEFLKLVHILIVKEEEVYFGLGIANQLVNSIDYSFFCKCHTQILIPTIVYRPEDWLSCIDLENDYWPRNKQDICKLEIAIDKTLKERFSKRLTESLYNCEWSDSFIEDISKEQNCREEILFSISKRLMLTQKQATNDKGLHDESVMGKRNSERRFRVTGECRIHYKYPQKNTILFLNYYGQGKHDKGLR